MLQPVNRAISRIGIIPSVFPFSMDSNSALPDSDTIRMQEKIAHLEHYASELSLVLYNHQKQMDRLSQTVDLLAKKLEHFKDGGAEAIPSEKPPHY